MVSTILTGLIAYEVSIPVNSNGSLYSFVMDVINGTKSEVRVSSPVHYSPAVTCGLISMCIMAILPAHLSRTVGGLFDNESLAIPTMVGTFYFWILSLRSSGNWHFMWSFAAALSYFGMVATWGGYVFVSNLIGVHAATLVGMGRFDTKIWASYSIFYTVGTTLATRIPVVGWTPLKSLEQMGPALVFVGYQLFLLVEILRNKYSFNRTQAWKLRFLVFGGSLLVGVIILFTFVPSEYFGPLSTRVVGLFVKHTKTGNPLVDSVSEHQATPIDTYRRNLHHVYTLAPVGYFVIMARLSDASSFLLLWAPIAYFFSQKMIRLVMLTAPIGSILTGIVLGRTLTWSVSQWWANSELTKFESSEKSKEAVEKGKRKKSGKNARTENRKGTVPASEMPIFSDIEKSWNSPSGTKFRQGLSIVAALVFVHVARQFSHHCWKIMARNVSNPQISFRIMLPNRTLLKADDYRESYHFIRDNTPADARVLAWWDYGYHIASCSNRTTLIDGNTWNHEHIALVAKALTSGVDEGFEIVRHLADYIFLRTGEKGDDLTKGTPMARIAHSVFPDHCSNMSCSDFTTYTANRTPSPMVARSLLYHLHSHKFVEGVVAPSDKFREVFRSRYGRARVYKVMNISSESKSWHASSQRCDTEDSWYCPGDYSPELGTILDSYGVSFHRPSVKEEPAETHGNDRNVGNSQEL